MEITVKANKAKRTYTIRKIENGKTIAKYRTFPESKGVFEDMSYNTENDWKAYLKTNEVNVIN